MNASRRAEAEAREREWEASEERYGGLFDGAAEAVFVIADDGLIEEANEAAAHLLADSTGFRDWPAAEVRQGDPRRSILAGEHPGAPLALPRALGAPATWVEVLASRRLIDSSGTRHIQAILHDVTLRYERQRGLEGYARRVVAAREEERRRIGREVPRWAAAVADARLADARGPGGQWDPGSRRRGGARQRR